MKRRTRAKRRAVARQLHTRAPYSNLGELRSAVADTLGWVAHYRGELLHTLSPQSRAWLIREARSKLHQVRYYRHVLHLEA